MSSDMISDGAAFTEKLKSAQICTCSSEPKSDFRFDLNFTV